MSETSNTIDKNVEEEISKVLSGLNDQYVTKSALAPLKSTAYTRLRDKGLLTSAFIQSEYSLIAEKKSKLPSDERAFVAYVMNKAISNAIMARMRMIAKQRAEKAKEEQKDAE